MGPYSIIKDTVFTGSTGRELRRHPPEVREVQFWLLAGPGRDPFGIFIFDPETVAPALGRTAKKVRESLQTLVDLGFCHYDDQTQYVWVPEMAAHQFGTPLKFNDTRCKTAQKWYAAAPRNPFLGEWFDRYAEDFHLTKGDFAVERREWAVRSSAVTSSHGASPPPSPAPSMGLVLNCSDSDSEQGLVKPQSQLFDTGGPAPKPIDPDAPLKGGSLDAAFERIWQVYPHAVERKDARAEFGKLKPTAALVDQMLAAIELAKTGDKWTRGYIPKLAKWLKEHRWHDKIIPAGGNAPTMTQRTAQNLGAAQRFAERRRQQGGQS